MMISHPSCRILGAVAALLLASAAPAIAQDGARVRYSDFAVANPPQAARFAWGAHYFATQHAAEEADESAIAVWRVDPDMDGTLVRAFDIETPPGFDFIQDVAVAPDGRYAAWTGREDEDRDAEIRVTVIDLENGRARDDQILREGWSTETSSCGLDFDASARRMVACVNIQHSTVVGSGEKDVRMRFFPVDLSDSGSPDVGDMAPYDDGPDVATGEAGGWGLRAIGDGTVFQVMDRFAQYGFGRTPDQTLPVVVDGATLSARPVFVNDISNFPRALLAAPDGSFAVGATESLTALMDPGADALQAYDYSAVSDFHNGAADSDGVLFASVRDDDVKVYARHKDTLQRVFYSNNGALAASFRDIAEGDELVVVRDDRLDLYAITPRRVEAAGMLADARDMWSAGFSGPGADLMIRAIETDPTHFYGHEGDSPAYGLVRSVSNGEMDVDLADMGRVLLAMIGALTPPPPGSDLTFAIAPDAQGRAAIEEFSVPNHPLVDAGVRAGDVIEAIDGRPTPTWGEALAAVRSDVRALPHGSDVSLSISRNGAAQTYRIPTRPRRILSEGGYGAWSYAAFGYLAAQAGHPAIARQTLEAFRPFLDEAVNRRGTISDAAINYSNLLDARIVAEERGADPAYDRILELGGLIIGDFDNLADEMFDFREAMRPFYSDLAKLAYVTGRDESEITPLESRPLFPDPVPYPDINGEVITPAIAPPPPAFGAPPPATSQFGVRPAPGAASTVDPSPSAAQPVPAFQPPASQAPAGVVLD